MKELRDPGATGARGIMAFRGAYGPALEFPAGETCLSCRLGFRGHADGVLYLRISSPAASEIAANFLGIDSADLSVDETIAVFAEMVNMIGGAALSAWAPEGLFQLDTPEVLDFEFPEGPACTLELECGFLSAALIVSRPPE